MRVKKKCLVLAALVAGGIIVLHAGLASVSHARPRGQDQLYLGLDLSTQSLKYTVLDGQLRTVHAGAVNFDDALPMWQTRGGVHKNGRRVTSPTLMWVQAIDVMFAQLKSTAVALGRISAVSASGQQHGSVYWADGAAGLLARLDPSLPLQPQLADAFAVSESPIWMDSSTSRQCEQREQAVGGALELAKISGSRAFERFTGNQIAALADSRGSHLDGIERIGLVSSFVASLLAGKYAGIDSSDAGGMNLMDIRSQNWSERLLDVTAPTQPAKLRTLLGKIVQPHSIVGGLSGYFSSRYGFNEGCVVVAASGDNPCSLAGLGLSKEGDVGISLGSSDTMFGVTSQPKPGKEGHVFVNPVDPASFFAMLVYENGGVVRESIRDEFAGGSWAAFSSALARTTAGNAGQIGLYLKEHEITPFINGTGNFRFRYSEFNRKLRREGPLGHADAGAEASAAVEGRFGDADAEVRAAVEGRFLSMRLHSSRIGITQPSTLLATGGGSQNLEILQIMADVFGLDVYVEQQPDAASFGAALRAVQALRSAEEGGGLVPFDQASFGAFHRVLAAKPDMHAHGVYTRLLPVYAKTERLVARQFALRP